jgi:hypothetical protein
MRDKTRLSMLAYSDVVRDFSKELAQIKLIYLINKIAKGAFFFFADKSAKDDMF